MSKISQLIDDYPDVNLKDEDLETVYDLAHRYLASEHDKRKRFVVRRKEAVVRNPEQIRAKRDSAIANAIDTAVRTGAQRIYGSWLPGLLQDTFALGDGRIVTWGEATIAEHEERRRFLESQAHGIVQTSTLHQKAINDLRTSGKSSLNELQDVAA